MRKDAAPGPFVAPVWYTKEEIFHYLKRENYSEQIARELSEKWSTQLQGAFDKGFEKAQSENTRLTKINEELVKEIEELKSRLIPADAFKPTDPFEPRTNIASDDENFTYGKR